MPASATRGAPAAVPPASLDFRVLRAVPFATVCVVLAAAGHAMGSGAAVPLRAVVLGWLLVLAAAVSGARRERSLTAITGAMAGGQLGLHLLFHAEQAYQAERTPVRAQTAPAGMAGMGDMPGMPGMSGGAHPAAAGAQLGAPAGIAPHASATLAPHLALWCHAWLLGMSPTMFAGHFVATVVAAWWLRRGEAAVWRLVRSTAEAASAVAAAGAARLRAAVARLGVALFGGLGRGGQPPRGWFAGAGGRWRLPSPVLLRHCVIRRGPPAAPAV
ncbi:hypothetical protein [Kitasatospora sp. NBC_01302]|uniref:hypothetical protein n=1 Tax=Kitasatospora sp. NBC_01302 TaxID=2903575 RepID=UPI002E13C5E5|nr:hypothetical protein OG294_04305 [Kitasatospora sp. NBC_01302]